MVLYKHTERHTRLHLVFHRQWSTFKLGSQFRSFRLYTFHQQFKKPLPSSIQSTKQT